MPLSNRHIEPDEFPSISEAALAEGRRREEAIRNERDVQSRAKVEAARAWEQVQRDPAAACLRKVKRLMDAGDFEAVYAAIEAWENEGGR